MNLKINTVMKKTITASALGLVILFASCGAIVKGVSGSQISVEKHAIPPDFGKDSSYLVCLTSGKNSYDKYLKKGTEKNYHGPHVYINEKDIHSPEYADSTKYRYLFSRSVSSYSNRQFSAQSGTFSNSNITTNSFGIYDRMTGITYKCPVTSSFFAKLIESYMSKLEEQRLKYQ